MAEVRAQAALLRKAKLYLNQIIDDNREDYDEESVTKFKSLIEARARGVLKNIKTINFYSERGSVNVYAVCVEIPRSQVDTMLSDIIREVRNNTDKGKKE